MDTPLPFLNVRNFLKTRIVKATQRKRQNENSLNAHTNACKQMLKLWYKSGLDVLVDINSGK